MNKKELLLGDYFGGGRQPPAKKQGTDRGLEQVIGQTYQRIGELARQVLSFWTQSGLAIEFDLEADDDPVELLSGLVAAFQTLVKLQSEQPQCQECQNYENHLQKLESDVRQHIRLEQQLKLYQDNLEERNEETKRENRHLEKEVETLKRKLEESKHQTDRFTKLESENDDLKNELRYLKTKEGGKKQSDPHKYGQSLEKPSSSQSQYRKFETKQPVPNERYPLTRTINFSSNLNHAPEERKSIDRKHLEPTRMDTEKYRQSLNNKSANVLRPPTDRRRYEDKSVLKDKENERRRTNKMDFRK